MTGTEKLFEIRHPKPAQAIEPTPKGARPLMFRHASPVVVLDMGEASREEGFRLNGCR